MVCENPYEFGDGLNLQAKNAGRIQTATGSRGAYFDKTEGNFSAGALPRISNTGYGQRPRGQSQGDRYSTLNNQAVGGKGPIIR